MTKAQERAVERIRKEATTYLPDREIKEFVVTETDFFVDVCVRTGVHDDEGTMAILLRESVQVFIGPRGGMRVPCNKKLKNGDYKFFYRKYRSFLGAVIDQRLY